MRIVFIISVIILFGRFGQVLSQDPYTDPDYYFYWQKGNLFLPANPEHNRSFYDDMIYLDIFFLESNPNIGWACGFNSVILKTENAGIDWQVIDLDRQLINDFQESPFGDNIGQFETIQFLNENVGYVSGPVDANSIRGCIYKSVDGGDSWFNITPNQIYNNTHSVWGFHFWDERKGVLLAQADIAFEGTCGDNIIFTTTDGGNSWAAYSYVARNVKFSDPLFISDDEVLLLGSSRIYSISFEQTHSVGGGVSPFANTTDGTGLSSFDWHEEIDVIGNTILLPGAEGCNGNDGQGFIRVSHDNGRTWQQSITPGPNYGSFLITEDIGWIAGQVNGAYYTIDGGDNWNPVDCGLDDPNAGDDIFFTDPTTGYLAANGVYKLLYGEKTTTYNDTIFVEGCAGETFLIGEESVMGDFIWNTGARTKTITVDKPGTYTLTSTYNNIPSQNNPLCRASEEWSWVVTAFDPPLNTLAISPDQTYHCEGDTVVVEFSGEGQFERWVDNNSQVISRELTESGNYIAESSDINGCFYYDTLSITFHPLPEVNLSALTSLDFCVGFEGVIEATPGYASYNWLKDGQPWNNANGNIATVTESGFYRVFTETEFGCGSLSDSLVVNVRQDSNRVILSRGEEFPYFGMIESQATQCVEYVLKNNGTVPYTIEEIYFIRNVEFTFPSSQLPVTLPVNDSLIITACYSPYALHDSTDRDTFFISDQCEPHSIIAVGDPLIYGLADTTECLSELVLRGINETDLILYERILSIYPNPADSYIRLESILRSERPLEAANRFILYDSNGQFLSFLEPRVIEAEQYGGYYYTTIEFDLEKIATGMYYIADIFGEAGSVFTIQR